MTGLKSISVPNPCHASWQQMTPVGQGCHCQQCSKVVTDFSRMSNGDIINYLAGASNICGRFNEVQLQDINNQLLYHNSRPDTRWKKWLVTIILLGASIFHEANGQSKTALPQKIEHTALPKAPANNNLPGGLAVNALQYRTVRGLVVDEQKAPLPGVLVGLAGKDYCRTYTNDYGYFTLKIPDTTRQLKIDMMGYLQGEIDVVAKIDTIYSVQLITNSRMLIGEPVFVVRHSLITRMYYKYIRNPFRKIFK